MNRSYLVTLVVLALLAAGYWTVQFTGQPPSSAALVARALSAAGKPEDRVNAVVELALRKEPETLTLLQRVAREAQDPEVIGMALANMVKLNDANSFDQYLAAVGHKDKNVSAAGFAGVKLKYGGVMPFEVEFRANDPPEAREAVARKLTEFEKERAELERKAREGTTRAGNTPVTDPAKTVDVGKEAPPSPPPSPSTVPSAPPSGPIAQIDYPAIQLLIWMCRVLAVVVLIAEMIGAFSLLLGEKGAQGRSGERTANSGPLTPEEQMERIVAKMATGLWSKIALLIAGAICIVGLLYAGEMIYLAARVEQTANRVEQKIDNLRGR